MSSPRSSLSACQSGKTRRRPAFRLQQNVTIGYISVTEVLIDHSDVFARGMAVTRESFTSFSDADKLISFELIFSIFSECAFSTVLHPPPRGHP